MAHLVTKEVLTPGFEGRPVKTEKGGELKGHTLEDVEFALRLLAYNNSRFSATSTQLEADYNIQIHSSTLKHWVSSLFTQRYVEIQHELSEQINKKLSAHSIELADKAAEAQELALEKAIEKIDGISADKLPAAVSAFAKAASENTELSQLLNDRPTQIIKHQSPDEAIKLLRELGLVPEETKVIEAEVVEE
jgi:hypothetical protein